MEIILSEKYVKKKQFIKTLQSQIGIAEKCIKRVKWVQDKSGIDQREIFTEIEFDAIF